MELSNKDTLRLQCVDAPVCMFYLHSLSAFYGTPYYPMTWDWGYNATLGQPGSLGGATRVDDIPIALQACAGNNFTVASDVTAIEQAFIKLFTNASPIHLTN